MIKFKELGIDNESTDFTEEKISILDLVNRKIVVHGYKADVNTKNGNRYLLRVEVDGQFRVVFTGSSRIISVLNHSNVRFPFEAVIESFKAGTKRGYMFS